MLVGGDGRPQRAGRSRTSPGLDSLRAARSFTRRAWDHDHDLDRRARRGDRHRRLGDPVRPRDPAAASDTLHLFQRTPVLGAPRRRPAGDRVRAPPVPRACPPPSGGCAALHLPVQEATGARRRSSTGACSSWFERDRASATSSARCRTPSCGAKLTPVLHARLQADHACPNTYFPRADPAQRGGRHRPDREGHASTRIRHRRRHASTSSTRSSSRTGFQVFDNPGFARDPRPRRPVAARDAGRAARAPTSARRSPASPTCSCIVGPNSAGGFNSIIFTIESHINYVAELRCATMDRAGVARRRGQARRSTTTFNRETERAARRQRLERRRLRELVPGRERPQRRLVARLHVAAVAAHAPLRREQLSRRARLAVAEAVQRPVEVADEPLAERPGVEPGLAIEQAPVKRLVEDSLCLLVVVEAV